MAITRRPKPSATEPASSVDVNALIEKGGSVARSSTAAPPSASGKPVVVNLRIPPEALVMVDELLEARMVKVPRHTWLLEAVFEKLKRDGEASK